MMIKLIIGIYLICWMNQIATGQEFYSKDSKILQYENAEKAIQQYGSLCLSAKCKDGILVMKAFPQQTNQGLRSLSENMTAKASLKQSSNLQRFSTRWISPSSSSLLPKRLPNNITIFWTGIKSDAHYLLQEIMKLSTEYHHRFNEEMDVKSLVIQTSQLLSSFSDDYDRRPLATTLIFCQNHYHLNDDRNHRKRNDDDQQRSLYGIHCNGDYFQTDFFTTEDSLLRSFQREEKEDDSIAESISLKERKELVSLKWKELTIDEAIQKITTIINLKKEEFEIYKII